MKPTVELDRAVSDLRLSVHQMQLEHRDNLRECQQFVDHVQAFAASVGLEKNQPLEQGLLDQLQTLSETLVDLNSILVDINDNPRLKGILWRGDVSNFISRAYNQFSHATSLYSGAQPDFRQIAGENETARRLDTRQFHDNIQHVQGQAKILSILGVPSIQFPQATIAIRQRIEKLKDKGDLEREFLEGGLRAMQIPYRPPSSLDDFTTTPFDVIIHRDRIVGEGGCSNIFVGHWRDTKVAIKLLSRVPQALVENEINILKRLRHDNVLQIFGACRNPGEPFLVCALKPGGDVTSFLSRTPDADRRKLCHEASLGLVYLHEESIIHGDIKPTNILVDENGTACLCDFGLSRIRTHQTVLPMAIPSGELPVIGTLEYMAPEQMKYGIIDEKSDIYSFGITVYEIFSRDAPFNNDSNWSTLRNDMVDRHDRWRRPPPPQKHDLIDNEFNDALWILIKDCCSQNPTSRPTAAAVATRLDAFRGCNAHVLEKESLAPTNAHLSDTDCKELPPVNTKVPVSGTPSWSPDTPMTRHGGEDRPITRDDIIIAILGPTGTGKSSFINTATRQTFTVIGHDLNTCTQTVQAVSYSHPDGSGRNIVFVDTPGFDDTKRSDYAVLRDIARWLKVTYKQQITLTGILLFHRISESRMHGAPRKNLAMFRALCGEDALQNVILTTTMWDEVTEETGLRREAQLKAKFWDEMMSYGCRMARFESTPQSAWDIINQFDFDARRPVQLQTEMVDQNKDLSQTGAYSVLLRWWGLVTNFRGLGKFRKREVQLGGANGSLAAPGVKDKHTSIIRRLTGRK